MLNAFRLISAIEGISYLLILCVTLGLISREYVFFLGMAHGVLFMLYLASSLIASYRQAWSLTVWLLLAIASVIPFAFIAVEIFIKRQLGQRQQFTQ